MDTANKEYIEKSLMDINRHLILEWKKLPSIVSVSHINIFTVFIILIIVKVIVLRRLILSTKYWRLAI